jgi:hypothetical protein
MGGSRPRYQVLDSIDKNLFECQRNEHMSCRVQGLNDSTDSLITHHRGSAVAGN